MKKSVEVLVHIFFWIVFTAFAYVLSKIYLQVDPTAPFGKHLFHVLSIEVVMGLIFFYITFFGITWAKKKRYKKVLLTLLLMLLLAFFALPATRVGTWEVMSSIVPHVIIIFLAFIFRKFSDSMRLQQEKQELLLKNAQSELALMKMQLSPHFLFNTLNNIDYLVSVNAEKASDTISKLGAILRYMLYESEVEKIELLKEIRNLENYIELLRLRTSGNDFMKYQCSGVLSKYKIAPMLFLPLVENAYKHSSVKEGEGVINIEIRVQDQKLYFFIQNKYSEINKNLQKDGGLGLNIVKRRLELIYPHKHSFEIKKEDQKFKVELIIQLDEY